MFNYTGISNNITQPPSEGQNPSNINASGNPHLNIIFPWHHGNPGSCTCNRCFPFLVGRQEYTRTLIKAAAIEQVKNGPVSVQQMCLRFNKDLPFPLTRDELQDIADKVIEHYSSKNRQAAAAPRTPIVSQPAPTKLPQLKGGAIL